MKKINDYLQSLGLTSIEASLYQGLLENGPTTIMGLAEHTNIKRITVHFNIESLITKGLVSQRIQGNRRQIKAEPPDRLLYFIEQKEQTIKQVKADFYSIKNSLDKLVPTNIIQSKMNVEYFEGKKQIQRLYDEVLKSKKIYAIVNVDKVLATFPENEQKFNNAINKGIELWEIVDESVKEFEYLKTLNKKRYHNRRVPADVHIFEMDYMIYENNIVMIDYRPSEPAGVKITNPTLYNGLKSIFDLLWNSLSEKNRK